jgi:hypothetical protein
MVAVGPEAEIQQSQRYEEATVTSGRARVYIDRIT